MTSPTASVALQQQQSGALAELSQETLALTRRLFLQLMRRPSTLIAGVLQPLIWLILFGALFANAPEGLLPGGMSYGRFLGAGVIVFTAFSGALNAGLPVMFDREFGFLNRLLVAPLRSRSSIVLASVIYITALSLLQSLAIMGTAAVLGYGWPGISGLALVLVTLLLLVFAVTALSLGLAFALPGHIELIAVIFVANLPTCGPLASPPTAIPPRSSEAISPSGVWSPPPTWPMWRQGSGCSSVGSSPIVSGRPPPRARPSSTSRTRPA